VTELRDHCERRLGALKSERSSWEAHWRELAEYLLPRLGRWTHSDVNRGNKRNASIVDDTATLALRTARSGLASGLTSPARPWFRLGTRDPMLSEWGPVKLWLGTVQELMREVFARSNTYNALGSIYEELLLFGTGAAVQYADHEDVVRTYPYTCGEYFAAVGPRLQVDALYREHTLTVKQTVDTYGRDAVSTQVANHYDRGDYDTRVTLGHAVEVNDDKRGEREDAAGKAWRSVHWEVGAPKGKVLRVAGFEETPFFTPRWDAAPGDAYGRSPAMDALGDTKQLQVQQTKKGQAIAKMVNPPLVAPSSLRGREINVLPGGVTYLDPEMGQQALAPAYVVQFRIAELVQDMAETRQRISRAFYEDLFLMLTMSDRRQITATEVAERHEEKLLMLGPVLERLQTELLAPLIDRTFALMLRAGLVPPAPEELQGEPLKVEYISVLAQAQRLVGLGSVDRLVGFVGGLAALDPGVVDKLDLDQAVDEYGEMLGVPPTVVRPDDVVAEIRAKRAQAEQAAQMLAMAQQGAGIGKDLAAAKTGGSAPQRNLLTDTLAGMGV
jgi:hypothetical protein